MDLKERIKEFCDSIGLSIREFERVCGLSRGNISNMTGALGSDKLAKIIDTYSELNLYWLVAGKGEMIREDRPVPAVDLADQSNEIVMLREMLADKNKIIALNEEVIASFRQQNRKPQETSEREALGSARSVDIMTTSGANPIHK